LYKGLIRCSRKIRLSLSIIRTKRVNFKNQDIKFKYLIDYDTACENCDVIDECKQKTIKIGSMRNLFNKKNN